MAPHLQRVPVLQPVDPERPVAVGRVALCGGCHGKLVRQVWVCLPFRPLPVSLNEHVCPCWIYLRSCVTAHI